MTNLRSPDELGFDGVWSLANNSVPRDFELVDCAVIRPQVSASPCVNFVSPRSGSRNNSGWKLFRMTIITIDDRSIYISEDIANAKTIHATFTTGTGFLQYIWSFVIDTSVPRFKYVYIYIYTEPIVWNGIFSDEKLGNWRCKIWRNYQLSL